MSALAFAAPLALIALVVLPALYWLLRLTPPPPKRLPLPTLPLVKDLLGREREPARTPLWLLLLRLALAAAVILAVAGPRWQPNATALPGGTGPLILMIDDGWAAAGDWKARIDRVSGLLSEQPSRAIVLLTASDDRPESAPESARTALARVIGLAPKPFRPDREIMLTTAERLLDADAQAGVIWISDGVTTSGEQARLATFLANYGSRLTILSPLDKSPVAISDVKASAEGLDIALLRAGGRGGAEAGLIRASDDKGRPLGDVTFAFEAGGAEAKARLSLPLELLNAVARLDIAEARHAGAVSLVDGSSRRRRVAIVTGETTDTAQPLVSGRFFATRALQPYSELREPARGTSDPIERALEERPDILVLVDIGTLAGTTAETVGRFVENGGTLIRFAGPGLAAASDDLLPVRLRRGGRILGGALSWDRPQKLGAFPESSPFAGIPIREEIRVERQVLAEPDSTLTRASWAVLEDGTPLVSAAPRGKGQIILFHVTADTSWSNLPLSGIFVDMLRRCLQLASSQAQAGPGDNANVERLPPRLTLDGFGTLSAPPATARPLDPRRTGSGTRENPPGFYGPPEASVAVNAVSAGDGLRGIDWQGHGVQGLVGAAALDLRPWFMGLAALLILLDALAVLWISTGGLRRNVRTAAAAALLAAAFGGLALPPRAEAQTAPNAAQSPPISTTPEEMRSALRPRIAFVITGNASVDEASRQGLIGLGQALQQRTAISLDEPIGINPEKDELVFFPMIYWPVLPDQPRPPEGAIRAIDTYMKNGGTVVFDTRDAFAQRSGSQVTAETRALRRMLTSLDIPALEPVPADHVLTKTFYLLDRMIGRYVAGDTWVEAISGSRDVKVPARAGDRVSPLIITSNDLAAAWAVDRLGQPLFPLVPGEPRQREFALRTGVNIVMYVMTGNYKADQVHVPALLERLGQ
ncbi:MAG: LytTR family transcriptional regulator [Methylobacterium sp.]|nr:MAG: LytTR family transcriptional regulator [Methylobacterium sp.]